MVDLKKFLDVDKLKGLLGKKGDSSSDDGDDKTENIKVSEDKIDREIDEIEKEEGKEAGPVPLLKDRKKIIRIIVVLGIAYFAVDQFILTPDTPEESAPVPLVKKPKKNKKNKDAQSASSTETASVTEVAPATTPVPSAVTPTADSSPSAIKEVPIAPTPLQEATLIPEATLAPEMTPTVAPQVTPQVEEATPAPTATPEVQTDPSLGEKEKPEKKSDLGSKLSDMVTGEATPAPKKMEVKEYIAPPDYGNIGRGLVYNCKGKHWACVDKDAYLVCKQNEVWQKKQGKALECSARNVYSTTDDCKIVQIHNVNTAEKTDFCK